MSRPDLRVVFFLLIVESLKGISAYTVVATGRERSDGLSGDSLPNRLKRLVF
jgi:hypothetical protein